MTQRWCFCWLGETLYHRSLVWRLNIGLLLRLDLFICHPTMHWETGDRRGWGVEGLFRRTTAGILQPNGRVFTLGCFLISHCNEKNIKNKDSFSSRISIQQTITLSCYKLTNFPNFYMSSPTVWKQNGEVNVD